jgi:hypothetical protein
MTTSPVVTTGEQVAETLHRLGYLIDQHDLPAPRMTQMTSSSGEVHVLLALKNMAAMRRWSDAADAAVVGRYDGDLYVAVTMLGEARLRLTAYGADS